MSIPSKRKKRLYMWILCQKERIVNPSIMEKCTMTFIINNILNNNQNNSKKKRFAIIIIICLFLHQIKDPNLKFVTHFI